jgi:hypothetical protein
MKRNELEEIEFDAVSGMLESAVSLAVPNGIERGLVPNRQCRGSPQLTGILVTQKDDLARPVSYGIVGPRRQLVFATIDRPRVAAALDRDLEAERGVGDDIGPGRWR